MSNAQRALIMAAGLFLAVALITLAVIIFGSAQDATKSAQSSFSDIQTELSQTSFAAYDGTILSGNQVLNAIRKYSGREEFGIRVQTGKHKEENIVGVWYNYRIEFIGGGDDGIVDRLDKNSADGTLQNAMSESHIDYINPTGKFKSTLVYDRNNVIRGILFEQITM